MHLSFIPTTVAKFHLVLFSLSVLVVVGVQMQTSESVESPGVIVLGMHRSGTSVVSGLLDKMGLTTGEPLLESNENNLKGFFERVDLVLMNKILLTHQRVYESNSYRFSTTKCVDFVKKNIDTSTFLMGRRLLSFVNNAQNYPWLIKEPRLCISIKCWLPFIHKIPSFLFIYRHPLDVALSMNKRSNEYSISRSLRMWYVYNRFAIQQSNKFCHVIVSHSLLFANPYLELERIHKVLSLNCRVNLPKNVDYNEVQKLLNVSMVHSKSSSDIRICQRNKTVVLNKVVVSQQLNTTLWKPKNDQEKYVYEECMRLFCALRNGNIFNSNHNLIFKFNMSIHDGKN